MTVPNQKLPEPIFVPEGKIALITAPFHAEIVAALLTGAEKALLENGVSQSQLAHFRVPGAFELPLACQVAAEGPDVAGVIALGVVIRGESAHFDFVSQACTDGVLQTQLRYQKPVMFGVLTTDSVAQAQARSGGNKGNKGYDVAVALLEMFATLKQLGKAYA